MSKESVYKFNDPLRFSRRLIAVFVDFLLLFLVSALFFNIVDPLVVRGKNTASHAVTQNLQEVQSECAKLIFETGLGGKKEGVISEVSDMAELYAYSLCFTSLGGEVKNEDLYKRRGATELYGEQIDPLYSYYSVYKPAHKEDFPDLDKSGADYIGGKLRKVNEQYFVADGYPLLNRQTAEKIDLFLSEKTGDGEEIFNALQTAYAELLAEARADFTDNYQPYVSAFSSLFDLRDKLIGYKWTEITLIYLCVTLLVFFVIPLFFKERVSPLLKLMKAASVTGKGGATPIWSVLIKWLCEFAAYFNAVFFLPILTYGKNSVLFLRFMLSGMPIYVLYIISAVFMIASVIVCAADKKNNRTLSDLISYQLIKDLR